MPNQNNGKDKKIVRTYSSDMAKTVQEKGSDAYRIARVEQATKEREFKAIKKQSLTNTLMGIGGAALIFAALLALLYFSSKSNVTLNPEPATVRPIIFFDNQGRVDTSSQSYDKILAAFTAEASSANLAAGQVENVDFTGNAGQSINVVKLLNLLKINPPKEMLRYLDSQYFVGIYNDAGSKLPFIILKNNSFADISPIIIGWENTMLDDLAPILGIDVSGANNYLLQKKFEDDIVSNKETRVIKDSAGNIVLMYVFLDEQDILIARNKNTMDEVLLRLYSPKK
jgi:hypothetical protein